MNFSPTQSFLLILPKQKAEVSAGGIVLPEMSKGSLTQGAIIERGPNPDAQEYKEGEEVMWRQHADTVISINGLSFVLLEANQIIMRSQPK